MSNASQARDFALAEIIKLTDSYRDMKINKVISAETARSVRLLLTEHPLATFPTKPTTTSWSVMEHGSMLFVSGVRRWNKLFPQDGARMYKRLCRAPLASLYLSQVRARAISCLDHHTTYLELWRRGHYKGVNEIIVFEKDDGHYDVR